jgi:superoxide dismutase
MEKNKYHLPKSSFWENRALYSVMQRQEDALNISLDGIKELWGLSPEKLLLVRNLPRIYSEDIYYYARACLCFEHYINSFLQDKKEISLPKGELARAMKKDIGSFEEFCYRFSRTVKSFRYVGFVWLVFLRERVQLLTTQNYDIPKGKILLAFSLWENAYIEKYGDDKERYAFDCLRFANWDYAEKNYKESIKNKF